MCRSFWMVQLNVQGASPRPWKDQRGKLAPPGSRRMHRRKRQHRAWTGSSYGVCDGTEKKMSESTAAARRHHDQTGNGAVVVDRQQQVEFEALPGRLETKDHFEIGRVDSAEDRVRGLCFASGFPPLK